MTLDRWIAFLFLAFSIAYGWAAWEYPILPFERNNPIKPNTLPLGLSALGILFSLILVMSTGRGGGARSSGGGDIQVARLGEYKIGQAIGLIVAMIVYAVALRPIGFVAATTLFLVGGGALLGERKFHILIPVALIGAGGVWYLVQEVLGIFLSPWPWFIGG